MNTATTSRTVPWDGAATPREKLLDREWLVSNGLGGYASGTVSGALTRKYQGLLVAALPAPLGRTVMWSHVSEFLRFPGGESVSLGAEERAGGQLNLHGADYLTEFRLEDGLPVWTYRVHGVTLEKRILLPHQQNTVYLIYRLLEGDRATRLELRPAFHFRHHESEVNEPFVAPYQLTIVERRYEIQATRSQLPPIRLSLQDCADSSFPVSPSFIHQIVYRTEQSRGYAYEGDLWSPGYFQLSFNENGLASLVGSTEPWETIDSLMPELALLSERLRRLKLLEEALPAARSGVAAELVFAADQFIITPAGRAEEAARAHAVGDEVRTVIAGYHWFTDWGRDTMISLEGLTITTGRHLEAGYILRTFAHYVRDGLIPNMFPDSQKQGLYHTADATLWFFHALGRYFDATGDGSTLRLLLPTLSDIAERHLAGTRFNIRADPQDGLLAQGQEGYALSWMDAKMGDWVVTPRRGKTVEINALWYNALCLLAKWTREFGDESNAVRFEQHAAQARASFNRRFWNEQTHHLYDLVDGENGDDPACRPNQVFAISLDYPVLESDRWAAVMEAVEKKLLTPYGLRSLSPDHPDYKRNYHGDLRTRDAAYHQGTVWGWLIGPFIDAWLKLHPGDKAGAMRFLEGFPSHLNEAGVGTISEVFDAEAPYEARGCIAQAWSVAEVLRCWVKASG
jgi:predicted glycogen debranching enzyme